ncbi:LytR family transcriptional regulator [bacterium]|nr:LytR family transcriptional regulator [bacterium]
MNHFLNIIIGSLVLIILAFVLSFNTYLRQETPATDFTRINTTESTNKIKLFENYSSQTLRVAVLNGCGVSGVGNSYGNILTNRYGLQVTRIENADNFNYEFTTIVILSKDNPNIENLLTILGTNINAGNVEFDATINPNEDIQIIIGKDYQEFLNLNQ